MAMGEDAMEEIGTHSTIERVDAGHSLPNVLLTQSYEVSRIGGSDLGGKQIWRPEHKGILAVPK